MALLLSERIRQRKFEKRLKEQQELNARGYIDPEQARRMTPAREVEPYFQVFADFSGEDGSRPCSPKLFGEAGQEFASRILEAINANICLGHIKAGNARIEKAIHNPVH